MKKIYCVPSHDTPERTSGVDFARIIQPMSHLSNHPDCETFIYSSKDDKKHEQRWDKIVQEYDAIFFNYTADTWGFAAMGMMARKYNRKLILDLDDSLWNVRKDNPSYKGYYPGSQALRDFTSICVEVDHIVTTNQYLKNVIIHNTKVSTDKITIIPNYIDLKIYKHRSKFKDTNEIQLLHFGSTTHFADLANKNFEEGVDMVFKKYPNVTLKTVGAFLPRYKKKWGRRYNNAFGHTDVYKWISDKFPGYMDETDILVTPLDKDIYNTAKSSIKWLEGSSAVKPGVWADIRQYKEVVKNGENGFLAYKPKEWYKALSKLIEDPKLRKKLAQQAFEDVKKDWQIQNNVQKYADMFDKVLTQEDNQPINR